MTCLGVSTQYRRVIDGWTYRRTDILPPDRPRLCQPPYCLHNYRPAVATARRRLHVLQKRGNPYNTATVRDILCCRSGDMILSVNGRSTDGATHDAVAQLLIERRADLVELKVVSWPGSPL